MLPLKTTCFWLGNMEWFPHQGPQQEREGYKPYNTIQRRMRRELKGKEASLTLQVLFFELINYEIRKSRHILDALQFKLVETANVSLWYNRERPFYYTNPISHHRLWPALGTPMLSAGLCWAACSHTQPPGSKGMENPHSWRAFSF